MQMAELMRTFSASTVASSAADVRASSPPLAGIAAATAEMAELLPRCQEPQRQEQQLRHQPTATAVVEHLPHPLAATAVTAGIGGTS